MADDDLIRALLEDRLDIAIVTKLDREMDSVRLQRLFDDELRAVVASNHPWAGPGQASAEDFADAHLVLYDTYDPLRTPALPLPIPPGALPGRLTTIPVATELLIEMVASGDSVTVLPSWIVAPYLETHDLTTLQVGNAPLARTWYCAMRHGQSSETIGVLSNLTLDYLSRDNNIARTALA